MSLKENSVKKPVLCPRTCLTRRELLGATAAVSVKILLTSCSSLPEVISCGGIPETCSFAVIAGSRISEWRTQGQFLRCGRSLLEKSALGVARKRVRGSFLLGNMINNSSLQGSELKTLVTILRKYTTQTWIIPGDREAVPPMPTVPFTREGFLRAAVEAGIRPAGLPDNFQVELPRNVTALVIDSTHPESRDGLLTPSTISWLKREATKRAGSTIIVLLHHPVVVPPGAPSMKMHLPRNAGMLFETLRTLDNLAAVFTANTGVPFLEKREGVQFIGVGDLTMYPSTYITVDILETELAVEFRSVAGADELDLGRKLLAGDRNRLALADKFRSGGKLTIKRPH